MTDTTRLPDASEDRVIECPVCSNAMTRMESEGVTVDVCAGGCGGKRSLDLDKPEESSGQGGDRCPGQMAAVGVE